MGHICGLLGNQAPPDALTKRFQCMQSALGLDPERSDCHAAWPQGRMAASANDAHELPWAGSLTLAAPDHSCVMAVEGVLDNRDELLDAFKASAEERTQLRDGELIHRAYRRWGLDCPARLLGDWVFAVWDARRERLILARDHQGNSVLYFACAPGWMAFSTASAALQRLPWVADALNPLAVAATVANLNPLPDQTAYRDIHILPPAHTLQWAGGERRLQRYWFPERQALWRGQTTETYCEALQAEIREATRRMAQRAARPGLTISAGLDSGAVAWAAAASVPAAALKGYCAVPLTDTQDGWPPGHIANEWPAAQATAQQVGVPALEAIDARDVTPLQGIDYMLRVNLEPSVGVGNMFWIAALLRAAQSQARDLLLTGQQGNGVISWYGRPWSRSFRELVRGQSLAIALRHKVARPLLRRGGAEVYNRWAQGREPWLRRTLLQPDFARRVHLREFVAETAHASYFQRFHPDPLLPRLQVLEPGQSRIGARWAERSRCHGLRIRDVTAGKRLIELCLSIPDAVWSGPRGADRWLIRRAMTGKLPAAVTGTLARGRQASDLFQRLQATEPYVTRILDRLRRRADVTACLDLERAQAAWRALQAAPFAYGHQQRCLIEIMPALGYGLFLLRAQDRAAYADALGPHRWRGA